MSGHPDTSGFLRDAGVASAMLGRAPAWLWDLSAGRVLLASVAGLEFFGEPDLPSMAAHRFGANRAPVAQLVSLARTLPGNGTPRLSLLRFYVGFRDVPVPCQCQLMVGRGRDFMIVTAAGGGQSTADLAGRAAAALGSLETPLVLVGPSGEIFRNSAAGDYAVTAGNGQSAALDLPEGRFDLIFAARHAEADADAITSPEQTTIAPSSVAAAAAPSEAKSAPVAPESTAAPSRPHPIPGTRRFTFQFDADGRFVEVGAGFAALVGPRAADVVGRAWRDIDADRTRDPEGRLSKALASRDTWSGVRVNWPTDFGELAALRLSALPRFAEGRAFVGFRGFADLVQVEPLETSAPAAETPSPTESVDAPPARPANRDEPLPVHGSPPKAEPSLEHGSVPAAAPRAEQSGEPVVAAKATHPAPADQAVANPKVFRLHSTAASPKTGDTLNDQERTAFKAIADALGAHWALAAEDTQPETAQTETEDEPEAPADPVADSNDPEPDAAVVTPEPAPVPPERAQACTSGPTGANLLGEVLERVPLGLAVLRDERVLMANRAFLRLFDYPDLNAFAAAGGLGAHLEGRAPDTEPGAAVAALRRDGTKVLIEARLCRTPWIDGPAMLLTARSAEPAVEDAAEAKSTAESTSAAELRAVLDVALDGVVLLDPGGRVTSANAGARRLFGVDPVGQPLVELVAQDFRAAVADRVEGLSTGKIPGASNVGLEAVIVRGDAPSVPVLFTFARIGADDPARVCAVVQDQSAWKAGEAELVAARKRAEGASTQKSDFLAKMSHEIRTPLNGILGFSEIILEERFGLIGNDRYREYIKDIRESGEHLMSLVNDLLDLSKIEAGKFELSFTGVRLNDLVEQAVAVMQPQSSRSRVIIRTSLFRSLPAVVADTRSIRQVLLNLLSNAIKFTQPGGQVIVSTALGDAGQVVLRIRDTGIGMSPSDVVTALEPFRQLPVTPTNGERGTGLGLPLAKALVESNRARFELRSSPGEGTLVEVTFPQPRVLAE